MSVFTYQADAQNVGVGTNAPTSKIDVQSSVMAHDGLELEHLNSSYDPVIKLRTNNTQRFTLGVDNSDDRFKINAGSSVSTTSPDFCIDASGDVGINEDNPLARLHVQNGAILARGNSGGIPVTGSGYRMMWVPSRAAFRAGRVTGSEWDNIGLYSLAMGLDCEARGTGSIALGSYNYAEDANCIAIGYECTAQESTGAGGEAIAIGTGVSADGGAIAIGWGNANFPSSCHSDLPFAMAIGTKVQAMGFGTFAIGDGDFTRGVLTASTSNSFNSIFNQYNFFTGQNVTTPKMKLAQSGNLGIGTGTANAAYRLQVEDDASGSYTAAFLNSGDDNDRYGIRIQAGEDAPTPTLSNYFIRCFDGDGDEVGGLRFIGATLTTYTSSDHRLKNNIANTAVKAAEVLNNLRVVDFNWKHSPGAGSVTGFIAQEVEQVYPSVVTRDNGPGLLNNQRMISHEGFIPILVKGFQELYERVSAENAILRAELASLEDRLSFLEAKLEVVVAE